MTLEETALRIATMQVGDATRVAVLSDGGEVEAVRLGPGRFMVQAPGDQAVAFISQVGRHWAYTARLEPNGRAGTNGVRYGSAQEALTTALRFLGLLKDRGRT